MELPESAQAHVTRVLRLVAGDSIRVFDTGREFEATIAEIGKHRVLIDVGPEVRAALERAVALHLMMSPLKGDLTELVIQQATQLGVARISPAVFERTDTVARRDPTESRLERWHRVAVNAAEQCGRAWVPEVGTVRPLAEVVGSLGPRRDGDVRIVAAEPSLDASDDSTLTRSPTTVTVAVGPAGGLSAGDLDLLREAGFTRERFAPHVLRSETACASALAILGKRYSG
jgi:16S rRNA (uracil1498-N3)-methyltransferase